MQYTLRNLPKALDEAIRVRARAENKSLNQVTVEALMRALGLVGEPSRIRDLSDIAGTWEPDPAIDDALARQRDVDKGSWR